MNLDEKLRKIEALFEGAKTEGERKAAQSAKKRILERSKKERFSDAKEYTVSLGDRWSKRLFVALCNKYDLKTYRYKRQKYTTTMVRVSKGFMDEILWPEFKKYSASLNEFVKSITDDLIAKIHQVEDDVIISGEVLPVEVGL